MSWLTVAVADGQGAGLAREGHRQADVVAQLVAKGVDGESVVPDRESVAVVADEVRFGAWGLSAGAAAALHAERAALPELAT
eukprot:5880541-Pleurochrysis_carterae.AAC.1